MPQEINFMVGGGAGQGVQSAGLLLAKALTRWGYHTFADQDYESRIRGGHNFFRVRASQAPVQAIAEPVDILIAFNKESIDLHRTEVVSGGAIVYDGDNIKDVTGTGLVSVPAQKLAEAAGDKLMSNTVLLGAGLGLIGFDFDVLADVLRRFFSGESGEKNVKAARTGFDHVLKGYPDAYARKLKAASAPQRLVLTGNDAMSLGAIAAGCKFMAAYPMTPTTSIMEYLSAKQKECGLVVVPAEDEIAAINMVVGAAYAGVRAMTATSGGGFCLMVEGLGLAGITETPCVIIEGQRAGPGIGLPTRTEQGDLEFILHAAHGEFPRAVLAPSTVEECFWLTVKAFNLADKYQMPVLVITDQHLASSYAAIEMPDLSGLSVDRGLMYDGKAEGVYKRHAYTESGISPRAFPGRPGVLVVTDSDEHDEAGHLTEDAETRTKMMQKRMGKLYGARKEIAPPHLYGSKRAENMLIGWGSTYGALREAADMLRKQGVSVDVLHFSELWPFPAEATADAMSNAQRTFVVEQNATGQLAHLIRRETGRAATASILRYDGRPFTPAGIVRAVEKEGCR